MRQLKYTQQNLSMLSCLRYGSRINGRHVYYIEGQRLTCRGQHNDVRPRDRSNYTEVLRRDSEFGALPGLIIDFH